MKVRSSLFVVAIAALGAASCNDSKIVAGASCPTGGSAASIAPQHSAPRPGIGAFHPSSSANATASDATPASAAQILAAMDVDFAVTDVSLRDDPMQGAAFNGLGDLHAVAGPSFAFLSTGVAGSGTAKALDPSAFLAQPGEDLGSPGCDANTFDCVQLAFSFVVPDNAHSLAFDFNFMSTEFPEFVNLGYNDSFKVSMSSASNNYDNLVFDHENHPINIDNAFFNQPCGELTGTGYDQMDPFAGTCDAGGTGLLTTQAPVAPGETVTLTFSVFDSGDGVYDSAVMIDNVRFDNSTVSTPNTDPCTGATTN